MYTSTHWGMQVVRQMHVEGHTPAHREGDHVLVMHTLSSLYADYAVDS